MATMATVCKPAPQRTGIGAEVKNPASLTLTPGVPPISKAGSIRLPFTLGFGRTMRHLLRARLGSASLFVASRSREVA